jgi:hypothetical protein
MAKDRMAAILESDAAPSKPSCNNTADINEVPNPSITAASFYQSEPYCCSTTNSSSANNTNNTNKLLAACSSNFQNDNNAKIPSPSSTAANFYHKNEGSLSCSTSAAAIATKLPTSCNKNSPFKFAPKARRSPFYSRALASSIYSCMDTFEPSACIMLIGEAGRGKTYVNSFNLKAYINNQINGRTAVNINCSKPCLIPAAHDDNMLHSNASSECSANTLSSSSSSSLQLSPFFETFCRPSEADDNTPMGDAVAATTYDKQVVSRTASSIAMDELMSEQGGSRCVLRTNLLCNGCCTVAAPLFLWLSAGYAWDLPVLHRRLGSSYLAALL